MVKPTTEITPLITTPTKKTVRTRDPLKPSNKSPANHVYKPPSKALVRMASKKLNIIELAHKRDVEYNGDDHFNVMVQMYGSVWPKVFPWCVVIAGFTAAIYYLRQYNIVDLTIQSQSGHGFMSILVSFLVVTRTTITYHRFMEARGHLADLYRSSQELVQYTCIYTLPDKGDKAKQWRQDVAYRTIITLRMATAAVEFRAHGINAWEALPDEEHMITPLILPSVVTDEQEEKEEIQPCDADRRNRESIRNYKPRTDHSYFLRDLSHGPRTLMDENMRAPIVWAYNLREKIVEIRPDPTILPVHPMHANEVLKLNGFVSEFVTAFHGLKKLVTTPFPFPLVQMTRTFLFFWIFSLPCVLIPDNDRLYEVLILMFFCTYGFLGLEYVNMELDDPHGHDPNDFPGQYVTRICLFLACALLPSLFPLSSCLSFKTYKRRWAQNVFEDIYITICKTDGFESAFQLRSRITDRVARGDALDNYRSELR
jgi:predicted membrane chloride channel (bestrophin family)